MPSSDIMRYGDDAMYEAQRMRRSDLGQIVPQVYLLVATPDPLGAIAAGMRMFRGDPPYSLSEVTDDERKWAWGEVLKTHLQAPLEFVDFQFMIEAVTRSFTHQLVRQRVGAVYAQESLRFAVKKGLAEECAKPPMVIGNQSASDVWDATLVMIQAAYDNLINAGIPAEDARGLLPHAVTTRVIYKTNLRGLIEHAGNRLCTQAQFEWRAVFMGIMKAIREYDHGYKSNEIGELYLSSGWQFELIGRPRAETFTPVCYKLNRCPFMSELDRGCTIRERVNAFSKAGVPSDKWGIKGINWAAPMSAISPDEWMANPRAGITTNKNVRPE